jgi:2-dehydropantoate 2-reductase
MTKCIAVVGTGAVGGYIAAHLAAASHDVIAIDGWPEHVEAMRSEGLRVVGMVPSESFQTRIRAMHVTEVQGLAKGPAIDVAIVSVKSYDTAWATALIAPHLAPDGYVVSAQNGINEERIAAVVGWGRTIGCVVGNNFAVDLIEAGIVKRTMPRDLSVKSLELGEVHGRVTPRLKELAEMMRCVDTCSTTSNLWGVRWSKLCVNGMRNALSAVAGMSGNERDSHDEVRRISIRLGSEAVRVGQALGYDLESMALIPAARFALAPDDAGAMSEI